MKNSRGLLSSLGIEILRGEGVVVLDVDVIVTDLAVPLVVPRRALWVCASLLDGDGGV